MVNRLTFSLPEQLSAAVQASIGDWREQRKVEKLWARDASLWTASDEGQWLGWLGITAEQLARVEELESFAAEVKGAAFSHVLVLGMGGSSLCPEVMAQTFGKQSGFPELHVLDSTDPAQVKA
jgi:transaldolase / glucose-6-phosphate isomerase